MSDFLDGLAIIIAVVACCAVMAAAVVVLTIALAYVPLVAAPCLSLFVLLWAITRAVI